MKRILVVEDDNYLSNAYRLKLTKSGYELKMARDGQEAMEMLKTFIPDLILLDLVMPVKDGFTTLGEIKSDDRLKNIPVIIASNLGQNEDIEKGMALGAVGYIIKSDLSLDQLINKINGALA
jgi:two-component system, OmpR family, alkaline phosphatase synthesis response regulator PhoP